MSSNNVIEKILCDAKQLNGRLKERDAMADELITATTNIQSRLNIMKQFLDIVENFNQSARHRPRMQLIQYLMEENHKIKGLEEENAELRQSLEEHQSTLEVIMSKYREQMDKLNATTEMEAAYLKGHGDYSKKMQEKEEKIKEMAAVMWVAAEHWNEEPREEEERQRVIGALRKRNRVLRSFLLDVASSTPAHLQSKTESALQNSFWQNEGNSSDPSRYDSDSSTPTPSPVLSGSGYRKLVPNSPVNYSSETLHLSSPDLISDRDTK